MRVHAYCDLSSGTPYGDSLLAESVAQWVTAGVDRVTLLAPAGENALTAAASAVADMWPGMVSLASAAERPPRRCHAGDGADWALVLRPGDGIASLDCPLRDALASCPDPVPVVRLLGRLLGDERGRLAEVRLFDARTVSDLGESLDDPTDALGVPVPLGHADVGVRIGTLVMKPERVGPTGVAQDALVPAGKG
jgi:hypothetical protein